MNCRFFLTFRLPNVINASERMMLMTDAEMYRKILVQVEALERIGVNYFDVAKEFFLIDSDNLPAIQTRFYGYSVQASGIYEEDNLTPEAAKNLDGRGCYVYVEVKDGQITIKQDLNGSYGIYLFRHGDYFALSNSFFRLLDHVKFRYPLTVNKDYAHQILADGLAGIAYLETAVNEIWCTERNAILHIDIAKKFLQVELIDYKEQRLSIDSEEGIATLDRWVGLWKKIIRGVTQHTKFFKADLSGGFDSRISLALLLNSGVAPEKVSVHSINKKAHTYPEDYTIASQIAAHYGFKLNSEFPDRESLNYTLDDIFNINFYGKQSFSNIPRFQVQKGIDKLYRLGGSNGETLRRHWQMTPKEFTEWFARKLCPYSRALFGKLVASIERILERGFRAVCNKYHIQDTNSKDIPQYIHQEVRSRTHFGKGTLCLYFINNFLLSPALDPLVRTLKLYTAECPDANLLMALIFARYQPDLLKFPFQGGRSIAPETIAFARKINERFPRRVTSDKFAWGGGIQSSAA